MQLLCAATKIQLRYHQLFVNYIWFVISIFIKIAPECHLCHLDRVPDIVTIAWDRDGKQICHGTGDW